MAQGFLWIALGIAALLVALALVLVLLRLNRTLAVLELTLISADQAIQEIVPEVRASLGNVNAITGGVNVALQAAGTQADRMGGEVGQVTARSARGAAAMLHGVRVGADSLLRATQQSPAEHLEQGEET
ncbi:MAG: hypothetical protein M3072_02595 [Candidatus Dormibacteraeota bacterium]|nr:hypothetical protein [Candidatus Dormibacteraeota bacterium]